MTDMCELPFSMPLGAAIAGRRSVRDYRPEKVDRRTIERLLLAATRAPTGIRQDACAFIVVQDKGVLKRISDRAKPMLLDEMQRSWVQQSGHGLNIFAEPDFNIFFNAGTLIVLCGLTNTPFLLADCWLAAENILLAAHASGLGSCLIGVAVAALNDEESRRELHIPASHTVVAPIIVGVPRGEGVPSAAREPRVLHWQ